MERLGLIDAADAVELEPEVCLIALRELVHEDLAQRAEGALVGPLAAESGGQGRDARCPDVANEAASPIGVPLWDVRPGDTGVMPLMSGRLVGPTDRVGRRGVHVFPASGQRVQEGQVARSVLNRSTIISVARERAAIGRT